MPRGIRGSYGGLRFLMSERSLCWKAFPLPKRAGEMPAFPSTLTRSPFLLLFITLECRVEGYKSL